MAILCYVTREIQNDASTHGIAKDRLTKFAGDVEKRQSLAGFDHFPSPCLTKKKLFGFNFRMIAAEMLVGEHLVIVFLRLVIRGGNEYSDFLRDPPTWANCFYDAELDDSILKSWVTERTQKSPPPAPPALAQHEASFLWSDAYPEQLDDLMICETQDWVSSISEPRIGDRLIRLPEVILRATDNAAGEVATLRSTTDERLAILTYSAPETRQCVLISASYGESDEDIRKKAIAWSDKLTGKDGDTLLRYSRRSYPSIICCDDDMWIAIQKDPQANLALSPEEAEILRSSNIHDSSHAAFPLFINGRAGSGKSTLLQYLFAQCFLRWARTFPEGAETETSPFYIASSRELLNVAKGVVRNLVTANHEQLLAAQHINKQRLSVLDGCFHDFLQFMLSSLSAEEAHNFQRATYVSYAKFRRIWMDRFGREKQALREYGPQISWHVIRGLIKGMSVDATLEKSDYDELPEDERTVSRAVFEAVHDKVWTSWYEPLCQSGEAWDSQDLVRHLVDNDRLPASHAAVFCDEAQDFTRLELEAIYRCALFSDRQIDFNSVKRVPFVFAGDPFQTLNPTGFRWESVRAAFTERILRSLYRFNSRQSVPQLNYRELTFNYRSSTRIVQLCNSIQAMRAALFGHRTLRPQSTWQLGDTSTAPMFFEKGDVQVEQALKDQSDLVLIVPCEEGEEVEFVANDPYLRSYVQSDDDGTPRNVLSAARAKGLEFLRVALYGWSARDEAKELARALKSPERSVIAVDKRLGPEYFLNNLYVAASRARRRLFIIDDKESLDGLWWFAADAQNLVNVVANLPRRSDWERQTGFFVRGVPESFKEDRDDPLAIAERFEREGLVKEDSYLLKQAHLQYTLAGDGIKAHECRAAADLFDGRFREAGNGFVLAGQFERAIDAFWRGALYKELADFAVQRPDFAKMGRCRIASFLIGSAQTIRECRSLFENLLENAQVNKELWKDLKTPLWKAALESALSKSIESASGPSAHDAELLADLIVLIESSVQPLAGPLVAKVLFAAGRYDDVLKRFDRDDGSNLYRDANALYLMGQEKARQLTRSEAIVVADYFLEGQKDPIAASRYYRVARDSERLLNCLAKCAETDDKNAVSALIHDSIDTLIANAEWERLTALLSNGSVKIAKAAQWPKQVRDLILETLRKQKMTLRFVIPRLARSDALAKADGKVQLHVSDFLATHLLRSSASSQWWHDVARKVAGAAIERAGKDIDALEFYERWRNAASSRREREYTDRRWVICKFRQASREAAEKNEKRAESYRQAAANVMEKYSWDERDVPDTFPELSDIAQDSRPDQESGRESPKTIPQDGEFGAGVPAGAESRGRLGKLSYRYIPAKGWINIESDDGLCARVLAHDRKLTSEDVRVVAGDGGHFRCDDWGLNVQWITPTIVRLSISSMHRDIQIEES